MTDGSLTFSGSLHSDSDNIDLNSNIESSISSDDVVYITSINGSVIGFNTITPLIR